MRVLVPSHGAGRMEHLTDHMLLTAPPRAPTAAAIAEALALLLGVSLHTDAAAPTSTPLPDLEDGLVAVPPALEVDEPLEGYDSDDGSMPELRTPTGSSDDEYDHI